MAGFDQKKRLTERWDKEKARRCHDRRELYVVVIEDPAPRCFIEISNNYVGVGFLDSCLREYLSYVFQEVESERLFLERVTHREFQDSSDKVKCAVTCYFKQDGNITVEKSDYETQIRTTETKYADVSRNWESYPTFGEYSSIMRENR